jgi:sulfur relay (sulfurtransferase) complex TusBCD TusD component (DsrE family)
LQRAIELAEAHVKKQEIDLSIFYLSEAKLTLSGEEKAPEKERRWLLVWSHENGAGLTFQLTVSMGGKVSGHTPRQAKSVARSE